MTEIVGIIIVLIICVHFLVALKLCRLIYAYSTLNE